MSALIHCFKHVFSTDSLKQGDLIDETDFFSIYVESTEELNDAVVLVTDIPLKLKKVATLKSGYGYILEDESVKLYFRSQEFHKVFDVYRKDLLNNHIGLNHSFYKIFVNYPIGICEISLYDDKKGKVIASHTLNVISSKIDSGEFSTLVSFVESKGSSIWAKYSLLKQPAEGADIDDRLDWLLTFCSNFIAKFNEIYLYHFATDKINTLIPEGIVESFDADISVSEESFQWLISNLDVLKPTVTYDFNKIIINNRPFIPSEILAARLIEQTDNAENQLVHGFLSEIHGFLTTVVEKCNYEISKNDRTTFDNLVLYYAFTRKSKIASTLIREILNVKNFLVQEIPVSKETIDFMHINKIESKEHYYFVYENLLQWLLFRDANYSFDSTFFKGITRLDQLFERGCFYKLIDVLENLGYGIQLETTSDYSQFNKVTFIKAEKTHVLYFQKLPESLMTIRKGSGNLLPDYVLIIDNRYYVIIDAKYKKDHNISKYDYPELTLKYLHGIGPKNNEYPKALALLVLYPEKNNSTDFYHKNDYSLYGHSTVLPQIGSVGINFEDQSTALEEILKQVILKSEYV